MGERYDKAVRLDKGIADRWKERTKESITYELTKDDMDYILDPVFRMGITENQGIAIVILMKPPVKMSIEAADRLRYYINNAADSIDLNYVGLVGDELKPIYQALGNDVVGKINFKSPGTGIHYKPSAYMAICSLIATGQIRVYESKLGGLSRVAMERGKYIRTENMLFLHEEKDPILRVGTIVHEATHAIQDWSDNRSLINHKETDAFIAGWLAVQALRRIDVCSNDDDDIAKAARFVAAKQTGSADWRKAYKKAVDAIDWDYSETYGLHTKPNKESIDESALFKERVIGIELIQRLYLAIAKRL
ncbi:MAG: hypothetical protein IPP10_16175 [Candidatus Competibacteraceae bacterium]|nr:hypothetical protein [Candidatus Competibacteraceae bacterium]MBK8897046.1 hypothetical protein [Candidatus Competibacteraceae bacterium]MBK9952972.1 hypothetical protein [Candidatus Competibacteraceae bacterium]